MRSSSIGFPLFILASCLATGVAVTAFGEAPAKARVAVARVTNDTGSASYDAACKAASDTLALTLRELGRYEVESRETLAAGGSEEGLRAMAAEGKFDFIMYGAMAKIGGGGVVCSLSVYDRAMGRTSLTKAKKAAGVLEIFAATDDLVVTVLEAMTGSRIGFGTIELRNKGEKGSYRVLMDGQATGDDLARLDKVLIGKRELRIVQRRMLGEREIAKAAVDVKEGASAAIEFSVPYLMDDEKARLEGLMAAAKAGVSGGDPGVAEARLGELAALVADVSYSPRLSAYKDQARQLGGEWTMRKARIGIEESAWDPKPGLLDAAGKAFEDASSYPDPKSIAADFEESAELLSALLELKAGQSLGSGDLDGASKRFREALTLSARYLEGERLTDYAYAISTLKELKERAAAPGGRSAIEDAKDAFGPWMEAGKRFAALRAQAKDGGAVLVASDFTKPVSVEGGAYAPPPFSVKAPQGAKSLNAQPMGDAKPAAVASSGKLLFMADGWAAFGRLKAAAGAQGAPLPVFGEATVGMGSMNVSVASAGTLRLAGRSVPIPAGGTLPVSNVSPGDYTLTVTYADGKSETKSVAVKAGQTTDAAFSYGQPAISLREYKIGEVGPAGGWVFYDKGSYADGWRYLEAAPEDASAGIVWGSGIYRGIAIPSSSADRNREYIDRLVSVAGGLEHCRSVKLCLDLSIGGCTDWFLPTIEQLELMYRNLKKPGLASFASSWYWSSSLMARDDASSKGGLTYAYGLSFSKGTQAYMDLGYMARVRAVRAF